MGLSPLGTSPTIFGPLYQPLLIDNNEECGTVSGMKIGKGNRTTRRKPAPVPICPPQIAPDLGSNPDRRGRKPGANHLDSNSYEKHKKVAYNFMF
jgi:hypothetical protein